MYRGIDDEHGFASRNRYTESGAPLRETRYAQPEGKNADIRHDIYYPSQDLILGSERVQTRSTEEEVSYIRKGDTGASYELRGIRRDTRIRTSDTSAQADSSEVDREGSRPARVGSGSVSVTARHEAIRDVVDRVAVVSPEGIFDSEGNIGNGRRDELQLDLNAPLDGVGFRGVTLTVNGLWLRSRVTDPLIADQRRISEDLPREVTAQLQHNIPSWHLRWGVGYVRSTLLTTFKVDELQRDTLSDRFDAFVEAKPGPHWTVRVLGKNLSDSPATRRREIYAGLRGSSGLDFVEQRVLRSGQYFGVNVQRTFGG